MRQYNMKPWAGILSVVLTAVFVLTSEIVTAQQNPRVANPGGGINVQTPPPPPAPPEEKKEEPPAAPPPAPPAEAPPTQPPQQPPAGVPPATPPGSQPPPTQPPQSGASASDTPLLGANLPLPNPVTDEGGNLPEPEPVPDELEEEGGDEKRFNILVKGRTIEQVLDEINKKSGAVVRAMESAAGQKVDLKATQKTVRQILDEIVVGKDLTWIRRADGTYEVWDKPSFVEKELRKRVIRRVFPLRFVNVMDVQTAIEGVKSDVGAIASNPRTNELIVTDLPDKVALIESLLSEIDVQLYTRAFKIKHTNFEELQGRLPDLKSPAGMIQVDAINRLIIVTDTFEKIKQMEQIIELLDIDLPVKVYHLNSIGIESEDAQAMVEDIIIPLATEDALIQYNESQSTLLVKDVAEVHDRILEVLKFMDNTPKQIWIEGEIMLVSRDYSFDLGTEISYSGNLTDAITGGLIDSLLPSGTETTFANDKSVFPLVTSGANGLHLMNLTGNLEVTMDALMSDDKTRILLQPRALVRNNEEVAINITQENPQGTTFQNTGFNNGGTNNGFIGSSIINVVTGLTLVLLPSINNRGLIEMELDFENSTPEEKTIQIAGEPNTAIARNSQRIQTILIIPSGETRVLGGLISRSNGNGQSGIPYLSKIPWVGWLFGRRTESESERNLLFFLTPTIVEEKPQIDVIDLSVNATARAMHPASLDPTTSFSSEGPIEINPIPEDLIPYIRQASPEPSVGETDDLIILPQSDEATSSTVGSAFPDYEIIEGVLTDEPSEIKLTAYEPLPFTGPGAEMLSSGKAISGSIGGGGSAGAKPRLNSRAVKNALANLKVPKTATPAAAGQPKVPGQAVPGQVPPGQPAVINPQSQPHQIPIPVQPSAQPGIPAAGQPGAR